MNKNLNRLRQLLFITGLALLIPMTWAQYRLQLKAYAPMKRLPRMTTPPVPGFEEGQVAKAVFTKRIVTVITADTFPVVAVPQPPVFEEERAPVVDLASNNPEY